jgi:hypothetical protein
MAFRTAAFFKTAPCQVAKALHCTALPRRDIACLPQCRTLFASLTASHHLPQTRRECRYFQRLTIRFNLPVTRTCFLHLFHPRLSPPMLHMHIAFICTPLIQQISRVARNHQLSARQHTARFHRNTTARADACSTLASSIFARHVANGTDTSRRFHLLKHLDVMTRIVCTLRRFSFHVTMALDLIEFVHLLIDLNIRVFSSFASVQANCQALTALNEQPLVHLRTAFDLAIIKLLLSETLSIQILKVFQQRYRMMRNIIRALAYLCRLALQLCSLQLSIALRLSRTCQRVNIPRDILSILTRRCQVAHDLQSELKIHFFVTAMAVLKFD